MDKIRRIKITSLATPIILAMMSQNILNLADTWMVGHLGDAALAAVGIGGFVNFMCTAIILGVSVGVQATAARRQGEGRENETGLALNTGLLLVLVAGSLLSILWFFLIPMIFPYLNSDPDVIAQGVPYLRIRILVITFVGMNFAFRGYWNAVGLSKLYMSTLVTMHIANIIISYILIFGKFGISEMGVTGAAIGTAFSGVLGTVIYFYMGMKHAGNSGFLKLKPKLEEIKTMVKLSLPNSFQQLAFSAGFVATFAIISRIGTMETAAANVLINITMVAILPAIGFGLAASTLVGQALGRKDHEDAKQWGWDVAKLSMGVITVVAIIMILFPGALLAPFIKNPETLAIAIMPMRLVGAAILFDTMGLVLMNALLGAGATGRVMVVSFSMQWLVFLPLAWLFGPVLGYGLTFIWCLQGGYRGLQGIIFAVLWQRGTWANIKV